MAYERVIGWLAEQGATSIKRLTSRGRARHPRLGFHWRGEDWVIVISGSPGNSWNADRDAITELKHLMGLVGGKKRVGARRAPKRRAKLAATAFNDPEAQHYRQFAPRGPVAKLRDVWPEAQGIGVGA
jgi:hypothetical protein